MVLVLCFLEARWKKTTFFEPEPLNCLTPLWPYIGGATSDFMLPCSSDKAALSWHLTQPEVLQVQHCWLLAPSMVWREKIPRSFRWHYTKIILASELHFCYPSSLVNHDIQKTFPLLYLQGPNSKFSVKMHLGRSWAGCTSNGASCTKW